ncbi:PLP-dependent aminotransferase family protein [Pseudoalteromonas luteoviolacea]|uniref:aminotransferase-like domain-containing protein n=1 Tax=Pseudoalteromonas luteoviolacea TaxID=43657 RepID=UPI001B3A1479|nr:PLP-dependent aminotransferase family protein [Pseudoalteromonas luteoviolacea]MBQ4879189.1 PLP-dependent aminotransferase family protein [Pseudoalteromonas luteoviolacea]MBQ4908249.1 PLP-dependent aminotransferase family protein [Pseudoalteromonas luteoviolacea]
MQNGQFLYQHVIEVINDMVSQQMLKPGDKLPSLRKLAQQLSVSIPTVKQAYYYLEGQGRIYSREKSGYFLSEDEQTTLPRRCKLAMAPTEVNKQSLIEQVYEGIHGQHEAKFGIANPVTAMSDEAVLAKMMRSALKQAGDQMLQYGAMDGLLKLKQQIAQRYLRMGLSASIDDIVITNGAQEALAIALQCVTQPGDVVAIESPGYFGIIELIENLGLRALEIPVCPDDGLWLEDLAQALIQHDVKACICSTSINNPVGSVMPEHRRQSLLSMLVENNVTLIEDDVYGDLHFSQYRAKPIQYYAQSGQVITCDSFSKTAAPSYRIGWMLAPGYAQRARRFKRALSCSSSLMNQWVLADYLVSGAYDRHLKKLRLRLQENKQKMLSCIRRYFPENTRISDPKGGCVVWIELDKSVDGGVLFNLAIAQGISLTPGQLFSATERFQNCIRLSFGLPWQAKHETSLKQLGEMVSTALSQPK